VSGPVMRLDKFFSRSRVVELQGTTTDEALRELVKAVAGRSRDIDRDSLLRTLIDRENTMTTYLGNGVALPHARVPGLRRFVFAVGRSRAGIPYDGITEPAKAHLILLLVAGENTRDYLSVLSSVARLFRDRDFVEGLVDAPDLNAFFERLSGGIGGLSTRPAQVRQNRMNRLIFRSAEKIARGTHCSAIAVFADTLTSAPDPGLSFKSIRTILVTRNAAETGIDASKYHSVVQVRSFSKRRLAQLRSFVLVSMTRGLIQFNDRICCIGGVADSDQFDMVTVVDVQREFQTLLVDQTDFLPPDVKPEVFERVLGIAMELAVEGREGRPVGCLFVLGDTAKVEKMSKPLVLNPFYGYKEEDRNILNPFMDETVKEFSSLDGAFIIRGDGVLVSSGSLIYAPDYLHSLPSGLGSRHAAAAAVSLGSQCISIVVSSSTGQVTVFRRGVLLPILEKGIGGNA
jgi:DNA integrity scanning protein DisA with diadenylate cyclase activity/mannitol/fructose-specific phosphotransferase system IIA component (Ntr-type)